MAKDFLSETYKVQNSTKGTPKARATASIDLELTLSEFAMQLAHAFVLWTCAAGTESDLPNSPNCLVTQRVVTWLTIVTHERLGRSEALTDVEVKNLVLLLNIFFVLVVFILELET